MWNETEMLPGLKKTGDGEQILSSWQIHIIFISQQFNTQVE